MKTVTEVPPEEKRRFFRAGKFPKPRSGKPLVIVESPAKVKTIGRILGTEYDVRTSMGHVRDLPVRALGVDLENQFAPRYVPVPGKAKILQTLKNAAATCSTVYLAPDPDREGEAIAWHLQEILRPAGPERFLRVRFNEITPAAVREAFAHPGELDPRLVGAQQARRVLDRLVGYMVSPILWRRIQTRLSAGRVQSVALRLICEREEEICRFVPEPYWVVGARVRKRAPPLNPFRIRLTRIGDEKTDVRHEDRAHTIRADLEGRTLQVADVTRKEQIRRAPPPFITSTLQQAASSALGFSPQRTMELAQRLYEGIDLGDGPVGLITYMRTDAFAVAREAQEACRRYIREHFGATYCPDSPNVFRNRPSAQAAHEAIRPTEVTRTPASLADRLDRPLWKLYDLIWRRFVASQMSAARLEQRTVHVEALPEPSRPTRYFFQVSDSRVLFPGYLEVVGREPVPEAAAEPAEEKENVPEVAPGETLECLEWLVERKETQPPPRYTEPSLIGVLESKGIGRPSTYAQILSTLVERKYVRRVKRVLYPTDLGRRVCRLLVDLLPELFNVAFTARMEEQLDAVEQGRVEWTQMLQEFYHQFRGWLIQAAEAEAPRDRTARLLAALETVREWEKPVQRGRRIFSDREFTASIREQLDQGHKPITARQFEALLRIAWRYRDQSPHLAQTLDELGCPEPAPSPEGRPPSEQTLRKLELLRPVPLSRSAQRFVRSLEKRVAQGRDLTAAQIRVLDQMLTAAAREIPDFERIQNELGIVPAPDGDDEEARLLLDALKHVQTWNPPVRKGERTFDDHAFYRSLADQFSQRRSLSPRQRRYLRRLVYRYRKQIPEFDRLMGSLRTIRQAAGEGETNPSAPEHRETPA